MLRQRKIWGRLLFTKLERLSARDLRILIILKSNAMEVSNKIDNNRYGLGACQTWYGRSMLVRWCGAMTCRGSNISTEVQLHHYSRRKFRSQTSDNMDRWKAEMGRVREEKRRRKRKSQKKEDPGARKSRKVRKHCVFPMIWGSGGSKK